MSNLAASHTRKSLPQMNTRDGTVIAPLPCYRELPVVQGAPPGSSWGLWGPDDRLGCLNLLTPERVASGLAAVTDWCVISLNLAVDFFDPPLFDRPRVQHVIRALRAGHDDELNHFNPQASTQWDGFRHIRHPLYGFYNGLPSEGHGVAEWASRGIVGRAILADVDRWRASQGRPIVHDQSDTIDTDDIVGALQSQGSSVEVGDVLLIRTGWLTWYRGLDAVSRDSAAKGEIQEQRSCGLSPSPRMTEFLWDLHISALAMDNPAVEVWPWGANLNPDERAAIFADPSRLPEIGLHLSLIPLLGLPLGELWDLDALAAASERDGRYECLLSSAPLSVVGGVGSPANALAIR